MAIASQHRATSPNVLTPEIRNSTTGLTYKQRHPCDIGIVHRMARNYTSIGHTLGNSLRPLQHRKQEPLPVQREDKFLRPGRAVQRRHHRSSSLAGVTKGDPSWLRSGGWVPAPLPAAVKVKLTSDWVADHASDAATRVFHSKQHIEGGYTSHEQARSIDWIEHPAPSAMSF